LPERNTSTSPIKVLHSTRIWLPQTQTWIYNQLRYLPARHIENHVVCDRTENLSQFNVPHIHDLSQGSKFRDLWNSGLRKLPLGCHARLLGQVAKNIGANILHSHFGNIGWENLSVTRASKIKHIVTFYGYDVNKLPVQKPLWRKRYYQLFSQADLFLCEGHQMANSLISLGCPEDKVKVQHLGIETDEISYTPRIWNIDTPFRVLIAAGFREKKGITYALKALDAIKKDIKLEVTIIGDASNDPASQQEKKHIFKTIQHLGLQEHISMLGFQPHSRLTEEAYKHHLFLSPSVTASDGDTEGGAPVSLIEMIATGMPVVSTNHCDIPEVVNYENKNWLVEERDVEGLTKRILWLIRSPENWQTMLDIGRSHVETHYNAGIQGKKLAEIYLSCL